MRPLVLSLVGEQVDIQLEVQTRTILVLSDIYLLMLKFTETICDTQKMMSNMKDKPNSQAEFSKRSGSIDLKTCSRVDERPKHRKIPPKTTVVEIPTYVWTRPEYISVSLGRVVCVSSTRQSCGSSMVRGFWIQKATVTPLLKDTVGLFHRATSKLIIHVEICKTHLTVNPIPVKLAFFVAWSLAKFLHGWFAQCSPGEQH